MFKSRYALSVASVALAAGLASPAIAGKLRGTVIDASETIALRSAQVRIVELDRVASTASDGSFIFADIAEGTYTVEVRYVVTDSVTQTVDVPATGPATATIALGSSTS